METIEWLSKQDDKNTFVQQSDYTGDEGMDDRSEKIKKTDTTTTSVWELCLQTL